MDCSTPCFPVHHQLPELAQIHVYQVSDAIQQPHPLSSPSLPAFNLPQHQGLFHLVSSVVSNSLWPHELQHTRVPCPSPTPGAYSNSCLSSQWCHPTISSSVVLFCLPIFPSLRVFSNESALHIRWPKYWNFSFSISPSNEYSGLISLRIDWLDLLAVHGFSIVFSNTTVQKN